MSTYPEALDTKSRPVESAPSPKVQKLRRRLFENLLTLDELLEAMEGKFTRATVYTWVNREHFPKRKIRGRLFFDPGEVALWFERRS